MQSQTLLYDYKQFYMISCQTLSSLYYTIRDTKQYLLILINHHFEMLLIQVYSKIYDHFAYTQTQATIKKQFCVYYIRMINSSFNDLIKILSESKPKIKISKKKISKIKKDFRKLRNRFSKSKINEFRRSLYDKKPKKSFYTGKQKRLKKILLNWKKSFQAEEVL